MRYPRFHKLMSQKPKAYWAESSISPHDEKEVKIDGMTVCGQADGYVDTVLSIGINEKYGPSVFRADWNLVGDAYKSCVVVWALREASMALFSGQVQIDWASGIPVFHDDEDTKFKNMLDKKMISAWGGAKDGSWERIVLPTDFDYFDGIFDPLLQWSCTSPYNLLRFTWGYFPEEVKHCHELRVYKREEKADRLGFEGRVLLFQA